MALSHCQYKCGLSCNLISCAVRILLLSLTFLIFQDRVATQTSERPEQNVQSVLLSIRTAVDDEIAADSPLIHKPEFTLSDVGDVKQLSIKRASFALSGFDDDLYSFPFGAEMNIELMRQALQRIDSEILPVGGCGPPNQSGQNRAGLSCRDTLSALLESAESHVVSMLSLLATGQSPLVKTKLTDDQHAIDELVGKQFYDLVIEASETRGIETLFARSASAPELISVEVGSVPLGAKISLMTELACRRQMLSNVADSQWPWIDIVQNPAKLLGRYRYRAQWPDGSITHGLLNVRSADPIHISEK